MYDRVCYDVCITPECVDTHRTCEISPWFMCAVMVFEFGVGIGVGIGVGYFLLEFMTCRGWMGDEKSCTNTKRCVVKASESATSMFFITMGML